VKRLLAFFAGGFGLGALFGRRTRPKPAPQPATPADELRQKLADVRATEPEPEVEAAPVEALSVEERRASVHERARSAIDELGSG
jgi:hypothetical protein